jgi:hypothetical protein
MTFDSTIQALMSVSVDGKTIYCNVDGCLSSVLHPVSAHDDQVTQGWVFLTQSSSSRGDRHICPRCHQKGATLAPLPKQRTPESLEIKP